MDIERTKEIVAKLLEKTVENGCTESEAAQAIARAQTLLAKYDLQISDIACEDNKIVEHKVDLDTKTLSSIQALIAIALEDHFGIKILKTNNGSNSALKVVGEQIRVDVFVETFKFAYNVFKSSWTKYLRKLEASTRDKNLMRSDYLKGFIKGFTNELIRNESENALVLVKSDELNKYVQSMNLKGRQAYSVRSFGSASVYESGYVAGSESHKMKNVAIE